MTDDRRPPGPGKRVPDPALPDHSGSPRTLSELLAGDPGAPVVVCGWWCPTERAFLRRPAAFQDEVEVADARLAAASVDPPEVQAAFRAGLDARFRVPLRPGAGLPGHPRPARALSAALRPDWEPPR